MKNKLPTVEDLMYVHEYGINPTTREIWINPSHNEEAGGIDSKAAAEFDRNIRFLNAVSKQKITVHLHSEGGDWAAGLSIYDSIKTSRSPVTIIAYPFVCSSATIILQAAKERLLMPNCDFMAHYGSIKLDSDTLSAHADVCQNTKDTKKMLDIFSARTAEKNPEHDKDYWFHHIKNKIDLSGNWWLTPEEVIKYGFADRIL